MPKQDPPPDPMARETRVPARPYPPGAHPRMLADEQGDASDGVSPDDARLLQFLNATAATLSATHDVTTLMQAVIDAATPAARAAFGAIYLHDGPLAEPGQPAGAPEPGQSGQPLIAFSGAQALAEVDFD